MSRFIAIQMDPLESINPAVDTTVLLGLEAQRRGYRLYIYPPKNLTFRQGKVVAHARIVTLPEDPKEKFTYGNQETIELVQMHAVLMRQNPPFDMTYITATYLLEKVTDQTVVVNDPASVRTLPEKIFPLEFPSFIPPTLITTNLDDLAHFRAQYSHIVLKPLHGFGGHGVFNISPKDGNFHALAEHLLQVEGGMPIIAQQFIAAVTTQEKRVIMIDGESSAAFARIPAEGEIRANMRVGGTPMKTELTNKQKEICATVGPMLRSRGLVFAGLDLIGDYITEINITSPTGLRAANALYGMNLERNVWDAIERRCKAKSR